MAFNAIHDILNQISIDGITRFGYFRNSYAYIWDDTSLNSMKSLIAELNAEVPHEISFTIPKLECWGWNIAQNATTPLFEIPTITNVDVILRRNGQLVQRSNVAYLESGPTSLPNHSDEVWWSDGDNAGIMGSFEFPVGSSTSEQVSWQELLTKMPSISISNQNWTNKTISFETPTLSITELENGYSYEYVVECRATPPNTNAMYIFYEKIASWFGNVSAGVAGSTTLLEENKVLADTTRLVASTTFVCRNTGENAEGGPFLIKGVPYNAYDLLRRALLTTDTHLLDNATTGLDPNVDSGGNPTNQSLQHPILVDESWRHRMLSATVQETIFEGKNLWEVLLQLGYYLHAIPYLEFAQDGTDRFILQFRQLGDTRIKDDISQKITVFTSKNLQDYFTQYDAYVTNLFSPQNVVEEWLVPKTSDGSYLISNDTAELHTSKPILEIIELDVTYNSSDAGGNSGTKSILPYIFENSIYQVLSSNNPQQVIPAKGNAIYYNFGDNKIQGLQYVPPQAGSGNFSYALQEIIRREFGAGSSTTIIPENIHYNKLKFRIKYRTQDSLRVSQVRPDLARFMKNSAYEKYPHHDQFYGQQDKIVDSERLSANLFGKLIRVGNNVYQNNEYAISTATEKEAGDLVIIENEPYYITAIDNELYPDAILQKVTYSKNFNQLANIVTIPSEPRFYEVSERSKIRREVKIMEFFELSTVDDGNQSNPQFIPSTSWQNFIQSLIFTKDKTLPNFAYTKFMGDKHREHTRSDGQVIDNDKIFPSSEVERTVLPSGTIIIRPLPSKAYVECIIGRQEIDNYTQKNTFAYNYLFSLLSSSKLILPLYFLLDIKQQDGVYNKK